MFRNWHPHEDSFFGFFSDSLIWSYTKVSRLHKRIPSPRLSDQPNCVLSCVKKKNTLQKKNQINCERKKRKEADYINASIFVLLHCNCKPYISPNNSNYFRYSYQIGFLDIF